MLCNSINSTTIFNFQIIIKLIYGEHLRCWIVTTDKQMSCNNKIQCVLYMYCIHSNLEVNNY